MKVKTLVKACAGLVLASAFSSSAYAALEPAPCSNSGTNTMTTADMTFNSDYANKCAYSSENNDSVDRINVLGSALGWGNGWEFLVGDGGNKDYMGFNFYLEPESGKLGDYKFIVTDNNGAGIAPDLPTTLDFVAVLKASDRYAAYLFDNVTFDGTVDDGGNWSIKYTNTGGKIPKLSHMNIYVRQSTAQVPEPTAAALLGIGLLGFVAARRRRSGKA